MTKILDTIFHLLKLKNESKKVFSYHFFILYILNIILIIIQIHMLTLKNIINLTKYIYKNNIIIFD